MSILVTHELVAAHKEELEKYGKEVIYNFDNSLSVDKLKDVEIIIGNLKEELLEKCVNLKYMHLPSAGSDTTAYLKCINNKIILTNSTGCFSDSMSEWIIGTILYFYKELPTYLKQEKQHHYERIKEVKSIYNSKILIIGCGSIGMTTARKLNALGAKVTGVKRTPANCPFFLEGLYTNEKVEELLPAADIVVLAMPQNNETRHYMDDHKLSLLKKDALLINVGRGSAIDTKALIPYLKQQKLWAVLDVHEQEPLPATSELWDEERCLVLPHVTGTESMAYTRELLVQLALANLEAYITQKPLKNVVDFETGYKISNS